MPKKGEFSLLEKIDTEEDWLNLANKEVGKYSEFFLQNGSHSYFLLQKLPRNYHNMLYDKT